jgi:3-hydroxybutyryl-CoA dehydratase
VSSVSKQLSQERIDRYAEASGDHNPIHVDPEFARATPFGGTIAHGILVLASLGELLAVTCGESWLTRGKMRVRFRAPARTNDTITANAEPSDAGYNVEVRNQDGELLISGTASASNDG